MFKLKTLVVPQAYVKIMQGFRRSSYATALQGVLDVELEKARGEFEATYGDVENKAYIAAIKRVKEVLFTSTLELE